MQTLRKKYFVKPGTQWKYLIIIAAIMAVFAVLCYYAFWNSLVSTPGMEQLSSGAVKYFKRTYTGGFFWIVFIFTVFVLIQSIFYFHRIIGPLYFFERVMRELAEGNFSIRMHWRKKDETKELAFLIGKVIDNTKASVLEDRRQINEAIKAIDEGDQKKAKEILSKVAQWCRTDPKAITK
ncbi:MAG: methyl-accepting chemotaxis protein [Endomicrobium sp.]|jgi:methyl-accepting chemotaxis protein|nr:methyl-accepting chemotaxis protein [Endomicrobium sp.]